MKRFLATLVAALMLMSSMAITSFAADYTMTLSADTTEVEVGDYVKVTSKISTNVGLQTMGFKINFDPTVFELVEDPDARAYILEDLFYEQEKAASFMIDGVANESEEIESYYVTSEYAEAYYGYKATARFGDPAIGTAYYDEDGNNATATGNPAVLAKVGFQGARTSAIKASNEATNMVVGGLYLKVIDDSKATSNITLSEVNFTTDGTVFADFDATSTLAFTFGEPAPSNVTVTATGDAKSVVKVTAAGADVNGTAIAAGTEVTLSVKPMVGYEISAVNGISAPLTGMGGTYTFTADADTTIAVTAAEVTAAPVTVAAAYVDAATKTNVVFGKASDVSGEYGIYLKKGSDEYVIANENATFNGYGPYFAAKNNNNGYFAINFHGLEAATYTAAAYQGTTVANGYTFVVE